MEAGICKGETGGGSEEEKGTRAGGCIRRGSSTLTVVTGLGPEEEEARGGGAVEGTSAVVDFRGRRFLVRRSMTPGDLPVGGVSGISTTEVGEAGWRLRAAVGEDEDAAFFLETNEQPRCFS